MQVLLLKSGIKNTSWVNEIPVNTQLHCTSTTCCETCLIVWSIIFRTAYLKYGVKISLPLGFLVLLRTNLHIINQFRILYLYNDVVSATLHCGYLEQPVVHLSSLCTFVLPWAWSYSLADVCMVHRLRSTSARSADSTRCLRVPYCASRVPTPTRRCASSAATSSRGTRFRSWQVAPSGRRYFRTLTTPPHSNRSTSSSLSCCLCSVNIRACRVQYCAWRPIAWLGHHRQKLHGQLLIFDTMVFSPAVVVNGQTQNVSVRSLTVVFGRAMQGIP